MNYSVFKDQNAAIKQQTRELLLGKMALLDNDSPRLLTLPADNFIFESMVLNKYPKAQIDCMEYNFSLFSKVKPTVSLPVNYMFGDIFDRIHDIPGVYDFIWADLCGNLSPVNFSNVISSVQNGLKDRSQFAVTLSYSRETYTKTYSELYQSRSAEHFRHEVFPNHVIEMGKISHPGLNLLYAERYRNSKSSQPMTLYVYQTF